VQAQVEELEEAPPKHMADEQMHYLPSQWRRCQLLSLWGGDVL